MSIIYEYLRFICEKRNSLHYASCIINGRQRKSVDRIKKIWKKKFEEYGIDKIELRKYFDYQIFRFSGVKFIPSLEVLFNQKSILKYIAVRDYVDKLIYKYKLKQTEKRSVKYDTKELKLEESQKDIDMFDDMDKKRVLKKSKDNYNELFLFCLDNQLFFNKKSKICLNCLEKNKCRKLRKNSV